MTDDTKNDCNEFADLFEKKDGGQALSSQEQSAFDAHKTACKPCSIWLGQHEKISDMAMMMPQFDVSEGLTQKILDSVNTETTPGLGLGHSLLPYGMAAAVFFFVLVPLDSWQSVFGWGAGLLGLFAFQVLMNTANTQEQVIYE